MMSEIVHKNSAPEKPRLSFILLDWGCRERFTTLDWLNKQDIPRDQYELIWVELYDRVMDEVMEKADIVITCNQRGTYHKHLGYNVGLLQARGDLICVCDSDAVFPIDFVRSVFRSFGIEGGGQAQPLVLMHYEWRTSLLYPDDLTDAETLKNSARWQWWPLIVNEGACVTVRRADAVRFGGFDEHPSYLGYLCGPYDLAWRLVNAGWPEVWHDSSVALWHFAHPDPIGTNGQKASLRQLMEKAHPHMQGHALTAVESFSTGRFQPLQENPKIWALRMSDRRIGSELETRYSNLTGQMGFSPWFVRKLWISLFREILGQYLDDRLWKPARGSIRTILGERLYSKLRSAYHEHLAVYRIEHSMLAEHPVLLCAYKGHNLVKVLDKFYAARHGLGLDLTTEEGRRHPELLISTGYYSLLKLVREASKQ
ncbi:MAG: glycosyltransferase family 2 protein [Nitrospira sp.]|nr:glycosyltransferase family 2 protein [Nitrospira sp.]